MAMSELPEVVAFLTSLVLLLQKISSDMNLSEADSERDQLANPQ
jgi:hypothetical protein